MSDSSDDDDVAYSGISPNILIRLPDLGAKIQGSTGHFVFDTIEGNLFCVVQLPDGKMELSHINTCFKKGYKHKAPVLELIQGGKSEEEESG